MKVSVELVYFEGCPHADTARKRLQMALEQVGLPAKWTEWDMGRKETPPTYRRFASPTILLDGVDIRGVGEGSGMGCVVGGGPTTDQIVAAVEGRK